MQHVKGYVYSNDYIFYSVWWVVALFIMIGGYNSYSSYRRHGYFALKRKLFGILIPYFVATAIYIVFSYHYFSADVYIDSILHFNASGPLYYVAVYVQLLIITPILIGLMAKYENNRIMLFFIWLLIFIIAGVNTRLTNIYDIAIGGGNVLAGPWLVFWFLGINIKFLEDKIEKNTDCKKIKLIVLSIAIALWQYYFVNMGINLDLSSMYNGTNVGMTWANALETVLIFLWFRNLGQIIEQYDFENKKVCKLIMIIINFIGDYSLYIFLYHMLFLSIYIEYFEISYNYVNRWMCLAFISFGPVIFGIILKCMNTWLKGVISEVKVC